MAQLDGQAEVQTESHLQTANGAWEPTGCVPFQGQRNDAAVQNRRSKAIPALTSIRFFLAISIVFIHYQGLVLPALSYPELLGGVLVHIVPAFFCLSGFVLNYQYQKLESRSDTIHYFSARVARILPLYWFCLFLAIALGPMNCLCQNSSKIIPILMTNFFMVQSWFPTSEFFYGFVPPAYTLSVEALMYLAFPLILVTSTKRIWPWLAVTLLVRWAALFFAPPQAKLEYFANVYPLAQLSDFILGALAARCFVGRSKGLVNDARLDLWLTSAIEILCIVAIVWVPQICRSVLGQTGFALEFTVERGLFISFFAILLFSLARERGLLSRLLGIRMLVVMGESSYALYLLHDIFLRSLVFYGWDLKALGLAGFASFVVFTIAASYMAYRWIEHPWRRQIIQYADRFFPRTFSSRPAMNSNGLLLLPFLLLPLLPLSRWLIKAVDELPIRQQTQGSTEVNGSENVLFGDSVRLVNLYMQKRTDGIEIKAYWRAAEHPEKGKYVGVHIVDDKGSILSQADHELLPQAWPVHKGVTWCDKFKIPNKLLSGGRAIGLAVYEVPKQTLVVQGGHCDWGNHRLLLPLQALELSP